MGTSIFVSWMMFYQKYSLQLNFDINIIIYYTESNLLLTNIISLIFILSLQYMFTIVLIAVES